MALNQTLLRVIDSHMDYRGRKGLPVRKREDIIAYVEGKMEKNRFPFALLHVRRSKELDMFELSDFAIEVADMIGRTRTANSRKDGMPDRLVSGDTVFSEANGVAGELCHGMCHDVFPIEVFTPNARATADDYGDYRINNFVHDVKATPYNTGCIHLPRWKVGDRRIHGSYNGDSYYGGKKVVVNWEEGDRKVYLKKIDLLALYTGDVRKGGTFYNRGYITTREILTKRIGCLQKSKQGCDIWQAFGHCEAEAFLAGQEDLKDYESVCKELNCPSENCTPI